MSKLTDRTSYLRGLAEGMKLNREKDSVKLILEILNVLDDFSQEMQTLSDDMAELSDYVEDLEDAMFSEIDDEEDEDDDDILYDEDDDDDYGAEFPFSDAANEDDEDDDDLTEITDEEEDETPDFVCLDCGCQVSFAPGTVKNYEDSFHCPKCGKELTPVFFADVDDDEDEPDDEEEDENEVLYFSNGILMDSPDEPDLDKLLAEDESAEEDE